jgi:hypothetical protein
MQRVRRGDRIRGVAIATSGRQNVVRRSRVEYIPDVYFGGRELVSHQIVFPVKGILHAQHRLAQFIHRRRDDGGRLEEHLVVVYERRDFSERMQFLGLSGSDEARSFDLLEFGADLL